MNKERYGYISDASGMDFEFFSEGPKGKIKKVVAFTPQNIKIVGRIVYNLGFGDLNPNTGDIDDLSVSNNNDRDKVLATVAALTWEFTFHHPYAFVHARGSTISRTRLYQIAISANLNELKKVFYIYGFKDDEWSEFEKNVNYVAFIALRRL
ncbi:DUF6934 family protein [Pedobacter frigoris]|uniref:DUF6934 family protein n=1 Tax=Pedobacter frigoris TaxID=2571272 RepID=UPI00292F7C87|nr:hypothetical protein [Pedobacter frigoris]